MQRHRLRVPTASFLADCALPLFCRQTLDSRVVFVGWLVIPSPQGEFRKPFVRPIPKYTVLRAREIQKAGRRQRVGLWLPLISLNYRLSTPDMKVAAVEVEPGVSRKCAA